MTGRWKITIDETMRTFIMRLVLIVAIVVLAVAKQDGWATFFGFGLVLTFFL